MKKCFLSLALLSSVSLGYAMDGGATQDDKAEKACQSWRTAITAVVNHNRVHRTEGLRIFMRNLTEERAAASDRAEEFKKENEKFREKMEEREKPTWKGIFAGGAVGAGFGWIASRAIWK